MAASIWDRVHSLEGKTIETLGRPEPFEIVSVSSDSVKINLKKSKKGGNLSVRRTDIETFAGKGWHRDELKRRIVAELPSCGVSSYIAAIVHEVTLSRHS